MQILFRVTGMTCAACSARVEKVSAQVPGVKKAEVNLLAGTLKVEADSAEVTENVIAAVRNAGYDASTGSEEKQEVSRPNDALKQMKFRIISSAVFLVVLMYFTMGHMVNLPMPHWYHGLENATVAALLQLMLTLPVVVINRVYYTKGLKALWHRSPNMDSLIAVGSGAALIYGVFALFRIAYATGHGQWETVELYSSNLYFESAAMIVTLITLGKYLETRAKGKTGDAIKQLMDLSPKTATVKRDGKEFVVPVEEIRVGDVLVLRSGSTIAVDGAVLTGNASVDQSALTGESVPVEKSTGDAVSAGTICTEGYLEIRAEKTGENTTLAQVIRLVEEAGGSKAPIARLADKIAGIFVPMVMVIAAIAFAVWMIAGEGFEFSLTTAIAVLVISCPCALGLATPVAIMVGTGRGAKMGVLFKNAETLENLHRVDTVVLDKTGTLTVGKPAVTDILPGQAQEEELMKVAASLEILSEHPFAKAILEWYGQREKYPVDAFKTIPGQGVSGRIGGILYYGGNGKLMQSIGVSVPGYQQVAAQGKTPLYFADETGRYLGAVVAADVLKEDSAEAVAMMKQMHLKVCMLTGDNRKTALSIAGRAGIDEVISDVLPGDKAKAIEKLKAQGRNVLMVGDGINDAPALVMADVGMSISGGTDIAMESANVVLMNPSLRGVANAVALSKATIRNIRQNLFWAFFYNCLGIPIAAGVLYPAFGIQLSPMLGAAAMSLSSVFVVTNALRLRLFKEKLPEKVHVPEVKEEMKMETIIYVNGMMCTHCKASVESACKAVAGVTDAQVDLEKKLVKVTGDAPVEALKKAITDAGYEVVE